MPKQDCADCGYDKAFHEDPKFVLPCKGFIPAKTSDSGNKK